MTIYVFSIYDSDPNQFHQYPWPTHDGVKIDCCTDAEAVLEVASILEDEAQGLSKEDGYEVGQKLYAPIFRDGFCIATATYALTKDDLEND